jgi:hypothetical protein
MIMSINDRVKWEEEVEAHFKESMAFLSQAEQAADLPAARLKEKLLVMYLSDVQELIALNPQKASEYINRIKFMINNCH